MGCWFAGLQHGMLVAGSQLGMLVDLLGDGIISAKTKLMHALHIMFLSVCF